MAARCPTRCLDDIALNEPLRGFGIFHLFHNDDLFAGGQKAREVFLGAVMRHPRQRDTFRLTMRTRGQGNTEYRRRLDGVIAEHLVEVPHAKKKDLVRVLLFDGMKLAHQRRQG